MSRGPTDKQAVGQYILSRQVMVTAEHSVQAHECTHLTVRCLNCLSPYSVHYGFYDYTRQYLEDFQTFIVAQNLESKLGALKEVGPHEAPWEPTRSITQPSTHLYGHYHKRGGRG